MIVKYKKKTVPDWLKKKITERDNHTCQVCGKVGLQSESSSYAFEYKGYVDWDGTMPKPVRFEIDHIVPEFLGGETIESNLQLACRGCNRRKGRT